MNQNSNFLNELELKLKNCVNSLNDEFKSMQIGRANPAILNNVKIDYYGSNTAINQIAAIAVVEARILQITPWDISSLVLIEKAIQKANLGINPLNDGKTIKLVFPQLTGERRVEIVKEIGAISEKFKISMRNLRKKALDDVKNLTKHGEISEDDEKRKKEEIQNLINKYVEKIENISKLKEKEVASI